MAPKRYRQIDDLPAAASSDDEIEEQEEDSSDQEQQQHEESKPHKTDPEQDEDESEESDDEEEQEEDSSDQEQQQHEESKPHKTDPEQDEDESEESDDEEQEEDSSDQEQQQQQHEESKPHKTDPEQDEDESKESDDEEEQEEDSSDQEQQQQQPEQDEDEEEEPVLHKHSVQKYPSPSQSEPSEGSGCDSDSDGTQNSPTASAFTIKTIASKPMEISPKLKKPTSKSIQLKQPSANRQAETEQNGSGSMNKKSKVSNGDREDGPGKNSLLNDEIVILKGLIDYQTEKDADPYSDMAAFHEFVKDSLSVDVSKSQLTEKIRRLKKKYQNNAEKGEIGEDPVFPKSREFKTFELSKKIWGGGVSISGVVKSSKRKDRKDDKVVNNSAPKLMENAKEERMDFWSMYPRVSESLESETSIYLSLPKDVKNFVKERISSLGRERVSQLEEKWKDIRVRECNLYAKRLELIREQTQMVINEMKPSKS